MFDQSTAADPTGPPGPVCVTETTKNVNLMNVYPRAKPFTHPPKLGASSALASHWVFITYREQIPLGYIAI